MKIVFAVLTYLFGAIPSGYLFFYFSEKKDIRDFGSGSTGATNVLRLKGWELAVPVLVVDLIKGALPVFLALRLFPGKNFALGIAVLAVIGHCYPVYIRFSGGKGIATTFGTFSVLAFFPFLLTLGVFLLVIGISRRVSLGSILSVMSFPVFVFLFKGEWELIGLGFILFVLITWRHRENIKRILKGKERKIGERSE